MRPIVALSALCLICPLSSADSGGREPGKVYNPPEKWTSARKAGDSDDEYLRTVQTRVREWQKTRDQLTDELRSIPESSPRHARLAKLIDDMGTSVEAVQANLKSLKAAPAGSRHNIKIRIEADLDRLRKESDRVAAE